MTKHEKNSEDEIDLITICLSLWEHKFKFIFMGAVGIIVGLVFTFQQGSRYTTDFMVIVGHPAYKPALLHESTGMQNILIRGKLSPNELPRFTYRKNKQNKGMFQVVTNNKNVKGPTYARIKEIITEALQQQRDFALIAKSYNPSQVILNEDTGIIMPNRVIAEIPVSDILENFQINFGETQQVLPNPLKHGIIGMTIGLFLGACWMIVSLITQAFRLLKKESN